MDIADGIFWRLAGLAFVKSRVSYTTITTCDDSAYCQRLFMSVCNSIRVYPNI